MFTNFDKVYVAIISIYLYRGSEKSAALVGRCIYEVWKSILWGSHRSSCIDLYYRCGQRSSDDLCRDLQDRG